MKRGENSELLHNFIKMIHLKKKMRFQQWDNFNGLLN